MNAEERRQRESYNAEAVQAFRQKFADERAATRKKYAGKPVEKYITYVKSRDMFQVQIGGKVWGRYLTIEGAQKRKSEILARKSEEERQLKIDELRTQLKRIQTQLRKLEGSE